MQMPYFVSTVCGVAALELLLAGCGEVKAQKLDSGIDSGAQVDAAEDGPPADAACADLCNSYCLRGTLTVTNALDTVNGNPSTMAFQHLETAPTDFRLVFDVTNSFTSTGDGTTFPQGQLRVLDVHIRTFAFVDSYMNNVFGAAYAGFNYARIALVNGPTRGVSMGNMVSPTASQYWGWETSGTTPAPIQLAPDGYPMLAPTTGSGSGTGGTGVLLRRYQTASPTLTDYADASWTVKLAKGADCL